MSHASMQSDVANLFTQANATLTSKKQLTASGAQQLDLSTSNRNFGGGSMLSEFARMRLNLEQDLTQKKKDVAVSGPWPIQGTVNGSKYSLELYKNGIVKHRNVSFVGKSVYRAKRTSRFISGKLVPVTSSQHTYETGEVIWRIFGDSQNDITINAVYTGWIIGPSKSNPGYYSASDHNRDIVVKSGLVKPVWPAYEFESEKNYRTVFVQGVGNKTISNVSFGDEEMRHEGIEGGYFNSDKSYWLIGRDAELVRNKITFVDRRDYSNYYVLGWCGVQLTLSNHVIKAGEYIEFGFKIPTQKTVSVTVYDYWGGLDSSQKAGAEVLKFGTSCDHRNEARTVTITHQNFIAEWLQDCSLSVSTGQSVFEITIESDYVYPTSINQLSREKVGLVEHQESIDELITQTRSGMELDSITFDVECTGGGTFYAITPPISALGCDPAVSGSPSIPTAISRDVALYQYCTVSRQNPLLQYRGFWTHGYLGYWKNYPTPIPPAPYPLGYMGYNPVKDEYAGYYGGQAFYNWDQGGGTTSPYAAFVDHFNTANRTFTSKENKVIDIIANGGPLGPGLATSYHIPNYPVRRNTLVDYRPLELEHPSGTLSAVKHSAIYSVTVRRLPVKSGQFYLQQTPTSELTVQFGCFVSGTFETIFTVTVPKSEKDVTVYPVRVIVFDDVPLVWKCDTDVFVSATICKPAVGYQVVYPLTRAHYNDTKTLLDAINN